jgi:hypothetical protein
MKATMTPEFNDDERLDIYFHCIGNLLSRGKMRDLLDGPGDQFAIIVIGNCVDRPIVAARYMLINEKSVAIGVFDSICSAALPLEWAADGFREAMSHVFSGQVHVILSVGNQSDMDRLIRQPRTIRLD